jgi:ATP phosphoribosyltransferase
VILEISARLIVNRTAWKTDRRVVTLVDAFRREAEDRAMKAAAA